MEKAWMAIISGEPLVFQSLDVKECDQVRIYSNIDTELSNTINRITIDRPISLGVYGKYDYNTGAQIKTEGLMMPDHTVWADDRELFPGTHY